LSKRQKKQTFYKNENIETINKLSQKKLIISEEKNTFFLVYGLTCILEMVMNGSTGKVCSLLQKLICSDNPVLSLAPTDDIFKNTSLIFHALHLDLSDKFTSYLKNNNIVYDSINLGILQQKITEINKQLGRMTNNEIKNPLNLEDFDADFIMLLINILYFKDS